MTRTPPTLPRTLRPRTLLRRGITGAAVLLAVGFLGGSVTGTDLVEARPRTKSATIAAVADQALGSLGRWESHRNPADYVLFVQSRDAAASMTAADLEIDPAAIRAAWAAAPLDKQQAVLAAMSQLGVPYRSIKSEPGVGFDCSGLTIWAFAQAGVEIPRSSRDQFRAAERVDASVAEPGDFVYYPGHISLYLGAGTMVHSPNSGSHVEAVLLPARRSFDFADPLGDD